MASDAARISAVQSQGPPGSAASEVASASGPGPDGWDLTVTVRVGERGAYLARKAFAHTAAARYYG